jgi:predicted Fe-Mo cluster-binding NifX family protein
MPLQQEHKVAVATVDGDVIASHFGSSPYFLVCTIRKCKIVARELRENSKGCLRSMEDSHADCWDMIEDMLPDVRVIITSGMGENAYVGFLRRDVLPIVTMLSGVEEAVDAYLKDGLKDYPQLVHHSRRGEGCPKEPAGADGEAE